MKSRLTYEQCKSFLAGRRLPCAFVELGAFDGNLDRLLASMRGQGKTMRVASKSIRSVPLLRRLIERGGGRVKGVMTFTVEEADFLSKQGFDDLLIAYPTVRKTDMDLMVEMTKRGIDVSLIVDNVEHVRAMGAAGVAAGVMLQAVIEADMSYRPAGGAAHIGVRRSAIRTGEEALAVARETERVGGVKIVGLMGYEAQIAGLTDNNPFTAATNPAKRFIKALSKPDVLKTRDGVVRHLRKNGFDLRVVNGGGTGSIEFTTGDAEVTEVTAGSGFYCPHLFDYYAGLYLEPAAFFALQVSRYPAPGMVTCSGGGYIASGETGPDRQPAPFLPEGCALLKLEGAGEVQTPVRIGRGARPRIGDPVIFRHAKAGELAERFNELLIIENGAVTGAVPTYRGMGMCFL